MQGTTPQHQMPTGRSKPKCDVCGQEIEHPEEAVEVSPEQMLIYAVRGFGEFVPTKKSLSAVRRMADFLNLAKGRSLPWLLCPACHEKAERLVEPPVEKLPRAASSKTVAYRRAALSLLVIAAACAVMVYVVFPISRHGIHFEVDAEKAAQLAKYSDMVFSTSDLILIEKDEALTVSPLNVSSGRKFFDEGVAISSHRDLPGLLPIALMFAACIYLLVLLRRDARIEGHEALSAVWRVLLYASALVFFLWYWTNAADHNAFAAGPPKNLAEGFGTARDLNYWQLSMLIQIPLWSCAVFIMRKFLRDFFFADFMPLFIGGVYLVLFLIALIMFKPNPYWRYAALGWWPFLFSISLLGCGLVSLRIAGRVSAPQGGAV